MKPFEIDIDTKRRRADVRLSGFWDVETFEQFAAALTKTYQTLHRYGGCDVGLVDAREFAVQSREILERFAALLSDLGPYRAKRRVIVASAQLNRFQFQHASTAMGYTFFTSPADAERWLSQTGEGAAAA